MKFILELEFDKDMDKCRQCPCYCYDSEYGLYEFCEVQDDEHNGYPRCVDTCPLKEV